MRGNRRELGTRRLKRGLVLLGSALTATLLATTASALTGELNQDLDQKYEACQEAGKTIGLAPDTDNTPCPKDGAKYWKRVAGARFEKTEVDENSVTSFDTDLYDVSFREQNPNQGFAAGSACLKAPERQKGQSDPDFAKGTSDCAGSMRIPTVYRYTNTKEHGERWIRQELGPRPSYLQDDRGYIGAIAWIDAKRALAVGGTGRYVAREQSLEELGATSYAQWVQKDPAKEARAWLYENEAWHELDLSRERSMGMRGLSAADCDPGAKDENPSGFCVAGALGQLWHFQTDKFTDHFDKDTDEKLKPADRRLVNRRFFTFRVRSVRFVDPIYLSDPKTRVVIAATAGCCHENKGLDKPHFLRFSSGDKRWRVDGVEGDDPEAPNTVGSLDELAHAPCALPGFAFTCTQAKGLTGQDLDEVTENAPPLSDQPTADVEKQVFDVRTDLQATLPNPGINDVFRLDLKADGTKGLAGIRQSNYDIRPDGFGFLVSPDGPREDGEGVWDTSGGALTSARFVSADGAPQKLAESVWVADFDWYGGELAATRDSGMGAQALVYATHLEKPKGGPDVDPGVDVKIGGFDIDGYGADVRGEPSISDTGKTGEQLQAHSYRLDAYSLNGIDVVGQSGEGWAVGDRGAIFKLSEVAGAAAGNLGQAEAPVLGRRAQGKLAEPIAQKPPPGAPGAVPSILDRPRERLKRHKMVQWGSPDPAIPADSSERGIPAADVRQIVMSRDGSEGWAIGPSESSGDASNYSDPESANGRLSLYHYIDGIWRWCNTEAKQGQYEADPACESLDPLVSFKDDKDKPQPVKLLGASRVPYENDLDPSNDDRFEVVAIGTSYSPEKVSSGGGQMRPTIIRYRNGRWALEEEAARKAVAPLISSPLRGVGIAFATPTEGWLLAYGPGRSSFDQLWLYYRYDGERWIDCYLDQDACGNSPLEDGLRRLPAFQRDTPSIYKPRLLAAGRRVYLFGSVKAKPPAPKIGNHDVNRVFPVDMQIEALWNSNLLSLVPFSTAPFILYRDPGQPWRSAKGLPDPAFAGPTQDLYGHVYTLSVAQRPDGRWAGWALGWFNSREMLLAEGRGAGGTLSLPLSSEAYAMRLSPDGKSWTFYRESELLEDTFAQGILAFEPGLPLPRQQATFFDEKGVEQTYLAQRNSGLILHFDGQKQRWEIIDTARPELDISWTSYPSAHGSVQALVPDAEGGAWVTVRDARVENGWGLPEPPVWFFHLTNQPHKEVFTESPSPARGRRFTAIAGAPDGTVWAATDSDVLYRYDRIQGWDTVRIPGWDPGEVVTRPSQVSAIALSTQGLGVAVGEKGRIADISPQGAILDEAAGVVCDLSAPVAPCGTARDLKAASVAPDGSALIGGERLSLLWRPSNGQFRAITPPQASASTTITAISMPKPGEAWLTTDTGIVFKGELKASDWDWSAESFNELGEYLGAGAPLQGIALNDQGEGYAVGERGLILHRQGDGDRPWRRIKSAFLDNLTAVAMPAGGGDGALIGGLNGLILTAKDEKIEMARPADFARANVMGNHVHELTGPVVGLALMPGTSDGQVEAWAAITQSGRRSEQGGQMLLHYASDEDDPLLNPKVRAKPVPDTPARRPGELSLSAFGNTGCFEGTNGNGPCLPAYGTRRGNEVIAGRVVDEIAIKSKQPGGPRIALFTGDAVDSGGLPAATAAELKELGEPATLVAAGWLYGTAPVRKHRRFNEQIADRLQDEGISLYGAIGGRDLSQTCVNYDCLATNRLAKLGENNTWRQAMLSRPAPWGKQKSPASDKLGGLRLKPLPNSPLSVEIEDRKPAPGTTEKLSGPSDSGLGNRTRVGGAKTHYAFDLIDDQKDKDKEVARVVVLDNSLRSLKANDPIQQPLELDEGQLRWAERMLCIKGVSVTVQNCTRKPHQQAIVVANTPTYSYGPAIQETATDAATFEKVLMDNRANVVISGRLGWNGRYWATAPGVHEPCPGRGYQQAPPRSGTRSCGGASVSLPLDPTAQLPIARDLVGSTNSLAPPLPPQVEDQVKIVGSESLLPFVIASSAGGPFAEGAQGGASQGFWHGYTIVRLDASGDPRGTIVEQRPVLDWITIQGPEHTLRPGQRMSLRGYGREPQYVPYAGDTTKAQYDAIDTPAITHRYDLVEADPEKPYLPRTNPDGDYIPLDPSIATIDAQTGAVKAGRGNHARAHSLAILSVADHVASYPIVFESRRSFIPPRPPRPAPPAPTVRTLAAAPPPPATNPPPTTPSVGNVPTPNLPNIAAPPPPPTPPQIKLPDLTVPPAPPVPPPGLPIQVTPTAVSVAILPLPGVFPQPAPPINPAPPSGARREARQRQAATEKSGSDSGAGASSEDSGVDTASEPFSPTGTAMTRRASTKPTHSFSVSAETRQARNPYAFTAIQHPDQPSAWARGALYGGGLSLVALALAAGFGGPRPKPRPPAIPVPAYLRAPRRERRAQFP